MKVGMTSMRRFTSASLVGAIMLSTLAGCSNPPPPKERSVASPTPVPNESRWNEPEQKELIDRLSNVGVFVDPDGESSDGIVRSENDASLPDKPAPISANGNIYVAISFQGYEVSRYVSEGWISSDLKGLDKEPEIECEPTANVTPQTFLCSALFQDHEYSSGIYYAVIITKPAQNGDEEYGPLRLTTPIYTRMP